MNTRVRHDNCTKYRCTTGIHFPHLQRDEYTTLLIRRNQNTLAFKHLGKVSILVHRHQNVASSNKLLIQIQLWDGRPIRILLDTCSFVTRAVENKRRLIDPPTLTQLRVFQHIKGHKFFGVNALQTQNLNARARETALRSLGRALHKKNHRGRRNRLVNCCLGFRRQKARMKDRREWDSRRTNGAQTNRPRDRAESLKRVSDGLMATSFRQ